SIWTSCASTRSSLCAKPHDQHHGRPILQNLTHTTLFIATVWNRHRVSGWLFAPYAAWVAFATLLNASLLLLN
ncbi:tryptophan-rich sensory protein, partial [Mesorhizobium sp. M0187]|uniref:tryptophan-rich sensory protein n=1 Tax=Mesorhizobium sp. M0187 TaxID=2956908 RepID=UPI003338F274